MQVVWLKQGGLIKLTRSIVGSMLLPVLLSAAGAEKIQLRVVSDELACRDCSIQITHELFLGDDDEIQLCAGALNPTFIARDRSGRWIIGPTCDPWEVVILDSSGGLVARVGKPGSGPGEIRLVTDLWVDSAGQILVVGEDRRIHIYSPDLVRLEPEPKNPLSMTQPVAVFPDGATAQNIVEVDKVRGAIPIHIVSSEHQILASFGDDGTGYRYDQPGDYIRWLAVSGDRLWAAHLRRYRIDVWRRDGTFVDTIEREANWFKVQSDDQDPDYSFIASIHVDSDERLWVLGATPQGTLAHADVLQVARGQLACSDISTRRDAFVEVIDLTSGQLVARAATDRTFSGFVAGRLISVCTSSGEETEGFDVWRIKLRGGAS